MNMKALVEELGNKLPRVNNRQVNIERKDSIERAQAQRIQIKVERDHSNAEQKRGSAIDSKKKKLNAHNSKVEIIRTSISSAEKKRIESKKERLANRLNAAQQKRELILEQVKNVASLSAKKKQQAHISEGQIQAPAPIGQTL